MVKIRMKENRIGSPNGIAVCCYNKDQVYIVGTDIPSSLANVFVDQMRVADFVESEIIEPPIPAIEVKEAKAMETVSENKMETSSDENKEEEKKEDKEEEDKDSNCYGSFDGKDQSCKSCDDKASCKKETKRKGK